MTIRHNARDQSSEIFAQPSDRLATIHQKSRPIGQAEDQLKARSKYANGRAVSKMKKDENIYIQEISYVGLGKG